MRRVGPSGGFVETHAGRQLGTDTPVLVKQVIQPREGLAERLQAVLGGLRAPSIPGVLEIGTGGDGLWIVTEGCEGESLRWVMTTLARASGFIAPNEGLAVVARVAQGLELLHRQGLVHGDICPSTIFITARGEVQLHDAGVAATLGAQGDLGPFRSELNALAPEQVTGEATPASDVFRLGLLLYELAIGRPLWSGPSPAHLCLAASSWGGLTRDKVKQVPEPWLTLLVTMLSVDPAARPSVEEVGVILEQAVTQNGWASSDTDIARLFARAAQGRTPWFGPGIGGQELVLTPVTPALGSASISPPTRRPAVTPPPGAVVARISTKKMTRDELAAVRIDVPPVAQTLPPELQAATVLVEKGLLTRQQVDAAKDQAAHTGQSIVAVLTSQGADEDALISTLAELTHTPSVSAKKLAEATPGVEAIALLPVELSRATRAVPLGLKGGTQLMVAMADPMDAQAVAQLKAALGTRSLIAFRAGERALADARARLYPGATNAWAGDLQLERDGAQYDPLALLASSPAPANAPPSASELPSRLVETLLTLQGARGAQALQIVGLAVGLASRLSVSTAELALARLAAQAMVAGALADNRLPYDVPRLADLQERVGFGTEADPFVEALHAFPARMPDKPVIKAVVLAFAFASHTGEARPSGSRLGGALNSFRVRHQLAQPLFELLTRELSG